MAVNFYKTDLGIFSVAVGDDIYNAVNSLSRNADIVDDNGITSVGEQFQAAFPTSAVSGLLLIAEDAISFNATRYNRLTHILPRIAFLKRRYVGTTAVTTDHALTGYSTKIVRLTERNPVELQIDRLNTTSNFRYGTNNISAPNAHTPYGCAQYASSNTSTEPDLFAIDFIYSNSDMSQFGWISIMAGHNNLDKVHFDHNTFSANQNALLQQFFDGVTPVTEDTDDPYSEIDGEGDIPGGGTISIPGFPGLDATSTGIIGLFSPTAAQMQLLADFMWTDFGGGGTSIEDKLDEVVEAIKRTISNPLDYIIGLNIIPSQGLSVGASHTVKFGYVSSGVSMPRLSSQYFEVDCGTLSFGALCGDTFLDYAPYSKFSIYLPYIGVREVDANDFVGHTIGVKYHGDVVTGGVTAYITKDGSVMYQFSGSCALNIPLSSDNWGSTIGAAVNIATAIVAGAASAGVAGAAKAALGAAASVAANPSLLSPQVAHSGAVSGSAGAMAVQYPFVIREAVRFHSTNGFNTLTGYPSFYFKELSEVSGYTKVLDLHLESIPATREEITEIEDILKEGAIF